MTNDYQAPTVTDLGSLAEFTLDIPKFANPTSDGFSFNGIILGTTDPAAGSI